MSLFSKDEQLESSPPIVGWRIMQAMGDQEKISIFDLAHQFRRENWFSTKHLYLGLMFLYAVGLVRFEEPYLVRNA